MCALLGRPRDEVLGRTAREFFSGADLDVMTQQLAARQRGEKGGYEIGITRPDGSRVPCFNSASPIDDARGVRIGSVGIWTDLSAIRDAESTRRIYEIVTNSTADMISVVDENEVYLMVNDAWCRNVGRERAEVLGSTPLRVLPELILPARRKAIRAAIEHQTTSVVTAPMQLPGVGLRHLESTYYPFADDGSEARRIVIITRDVTRAEQDRAALMTSAEYLRLTLNATHDAIFASDAASVDEPVRFANDQLFSLWGIRRDEGGALTPRRVLDHAFALFLDPELERRRIEDIVERDGPSEHQVQLRDGRILWRRCVRTTLHGTEVRVWSFRDITAEQRALAAVRASAATQRSLLDAFPGMIAVIDGQDRYSYVNRRLAALFGRSAEDIVGRAFSTLLEPSRAASIAAAVSQARREGRASTTSHYPATDTRPAVDIEVEHIAGPPQADGSQSVFTFGSDVTERKRVQAALVVALEQAERANAAKSMFLSSMSHELRTPMNAILGFGQLLETDAEDPLSARQRKFVLEILHGGQHLLALINELLDLGSIEAGELKIDNRRLAPGPLIDDCINLLRPLALARSIDIQCPATAEAPPPQVWADPKRLRQVLLNLLSNAIKYNRPGGRVEVSAVDLGPWLEIRVADTGPGLSADQQQRLFRPFERLDARHGSVEGTGIALALSRRLVEAMEGEIGLDSEPGQGSVFRVRLRRPAPTPDAGTPGTGGRSAESGGSQAALAGCTALYIEDNPVNVMLMEAALEGTLSLTCELEPIAGLERARSLQPDIVLLDVQLPGIDGFEVLRRLRADPLTRSIPVVAVTANAMPATAAAGQTAGFDAYLTKPLDIRLLLETLRRVLEDSRNRQPRSADTSG
jgi:PAS domain S-box-containing protein